MSKYTTTFRNLIDGGFVTRDEIENIFKSYQLSDYLTSEEIEVIENRGTWNKDKLATKIVDHYYFKELGFETYALFKHYAEVQIKEIMESKLPLIYSSSIKYDPLINVDYTESYNSESKSTSQGSGLSVNSDTPQGQISKSAILGGAYASNTGASESTASGNDVSNYTKNVKGNSGVSATAQAMIKQYRENIRSIDLEIINELNDLFFGLF